MTLLGPSLQSYFTDHAHAQKGLSPNTIASYRDTWRLLVKHLCATTGLPADKLDLRCPHDAGPRAHQGRRPGARGPAV